MYGLRYTTMNGEHSDPADYDTLDEAMHEAVKAFGPHDQGGLVSALAVQIYEHPRPVLRMVVSRQQSGTHVQLLTDPDERQPLPARGEGHQKPTSSPKRPQG